MPKLVLVSDGGVVEAIQSDPLQPSDLGWLNAAILAEKSLVVVKDDVPVSGGQRLYPMRLRDDSEDERGDAIVPEGIEQAVIGHQENDERRGIPVLPFASLKVAGSAVEPRGVLHPIAWPSGDGSQSFGDAVCHAGGNQVKSIVSAAGQYVLHNHDPSAVLGGEPNFGSAKADAATFRSNVGESASGVKSPAVRLLEHLESSVDRAVDALDLARAVRYELDKATSAQALADSLAMQVSTIIKICDGLDVGDWSMSENVIGRVFRMRQELDNARGWIGERIREDERRQKDLAGLPEASEMPKFEVGKFYRRRDGQIVGPLEIPNPDAPYPLTAGKMWYDSLGRFDSLSIVESPYDLLPGSVELVWNAPKSLPDGEYKFCDVTGSLTSASAPVGLVWVDQMFKERDPMPPMPGIWKNEGGIGRFVRS